MRLVLIILTLLPFSSIKSYEIKATGGGIVPLGSDLELSLVVGKVWDRCRWFLYEHHKDYQYCSFDLDADTGVAEKHKCQPTNTSDIMKYTGNNTNECTITIHNVTEEYDCSWAGRLDEDLTNSYINITIARPVKNMTIEIVGDLVADQPGHIKCLANGGRPAPMMSFQITDPMPEFLNNTLNQTPDEDGIFTSVQEAFINPKIEDHGKVIECKAMIKDGEEKMLFDLVEAPTLKMNVTFPPQSASNQSLSAEKGSNLTITFNFTSNPMPSSVSWLVTIPEVVRMDKYEQLREEIFAELDEAGDNGNATNSSSIIELTPGHSDDKYEVSEVEPVEGEEVTYQISMTIFDVKDQDHDDSYEVQVSNGLGEQSYFFNVDVEGFDPTTENPADDDNNPDNPKVPKSKVAGLIVVLCLLGILLLIVGFFVMYKRKMVNNETTPLSALETRH